MGRKNSVIADGTPAKQQSSPYWIELLYLLLLFGAVALVVINTMNTRREIAYIDKEIANAYSEIQNSKCLIANLEKTRESLKNDKVLAFARKHKMSHPMPGQKYAMTTRQLSTGQQDIMYAKHQGVPALNAVATVHKALSPSAGGKGN